MVSTEQLQQLIETFRASGARSLTFYPAGNPGKAMYVTVQMHTDDDVHAAADAIGTSKPRMVSGGNHRWLLSESLNVAGLPDVHLEIGGPHSVAVTSTEVAS